MIVRVASHNNELIFFKILGFPIGPAHPSLKHACKIIPIDQTVLSAPNSSRRPRELVRMIVCPLKVGKSNPRPDAHRGPLPIGGNRPHICIDLVPPHLRQRLKDVFDRCDREYGNSPH